MTEYGFTAGQTGSPNLANIKIAGQDFIRNSESNGRGRPTVDHIVSLDMAKEISMIQRTDKKGGGGLRSEKSDRTNMIAVKNDYRSKMTAHPRDSVTTF